MLTCAVNAAILPSPSGGTYCSKVEAVAATYIGSSKVVEAGCLVFSSGKKNSLSNYIITKKLMKMQKIMKTTNQSYLFELSRFMAQILVISKIMELITD